MTQTGLREGEGETARQTFVLLVLLFAIAVQNFWLLLLLCCLWSPRK
jgi:hypothetical protein